MTEKCEFCESSGVDSYHCPIPAKQFTDTCKYCQQPLALDSCNTGTDHHRTCGIAFIAGRKSGMDECIKIVDNHTGRFYDSETQDFIDALTSEIVAALWEKKTHE